jgi:hypothetical protein
VLNAVAIGMLMASAASAQTEQNASVYPNTEYISGKQGFAKPVKGQLVIQEQEITFKESNGNVVFTIPMVSVVSASDEVETDPGSFARKALLGVFASKREEFLTVEVHTPNGAEAVVFKGKKKTAAGMAAKIQFYRKKVASE